MKRWVPFLLLLFLLMPVPGALAADDEPHEHVFGDWYTVADATCTALGEERRDCANCDAYETREIPMKEHAFGDWYTVTDATCTALGEERRDCANCDAFETREIPMKEHAFREWETVTEPGCLSFGLAQRVCESCSLAETKSLPMLGHSFVVDPAVPATCTTEGRTQGEHCERCGAVLWPGPVTLKPLGHFLDENGDCKICGAHIKDLCPYCGQDHSGQLFGGLIAWLHGILLRLRELFQK
ncbi:MAG: hypothetical protein II621_05140 [Clostridia bacterium]|nr:hypothetical protein [Clostridia bacterium]